MNKNGIIDRMKAIQTVLTREQRAQYDDAKNAFLENAKNNCDIVAGRFAEIYEGLQKVEELLETHVEQGRKVVSVSANTISAALNKVRDMLAEVRG